MIYLLVTFCNSSFLASMLAYSVVCANIILLQFLIQLVDFHEIW
jgi:hypothetical protein